VKRREEGVKPTCFMSKATSVRQANHSKYSLSIEGINLIVESKSLPIAHFEKEWWERGRATSAYGSKNYKRL